MSIGDFFKGLLLDAWYKALVYIGGIALVLSFFVDAKGISNVHLQLIAGGIFLIGLGEWKNHKENSWIKPPNAYTGPAMLMTQIAWRPDIIGLALDLGGALLLNAGIFGASRPTVPIVPTPTVAAPTATSTTAPAFTSTPLPTGTTVPPSTPTSLKVNPAWIALRLTSMVLLVKAVPVDELQCQRPS